MGLAPRRLRHSMHWRASLSASLSVHVPSVSCLITDWSNINTAYYLLGSSTIGLIVRNNAPDALSPVDTRVLVRSCPKRLSNLVNERPTNYSIKAMCCDTCKCQNCDRRTNGIKSMLKPAPNGATRFRASPSDARSLPLDITVCTPFSQSLPLKTLQCAESTPKQWSTYANGGVVADDARALQLLRNEEAEFLEATRSRTPAAGPPSTPLIQISPEKVVASRNTDLLLDLNIINDPGMRVPYAQIARASTNVTKEQTRTALNWLD